MDGLIIREAHEEDVAAIAAMFAADDVGGHGDTTDDVAMPDYLRAFRAIAMSPLETLYVAEFEGRVIGTFQTVILTKLAGRGAVWMVVEGVQTREDMRGRGIGATMIRYCIAEAEKLGLAGVQLTSNMARTDAHRFYERLGFEKRHFGFRLKLK